jgi:hypothetical protein
MGHPQSVFLCRTKTDKTAPHIARRTTARERGSDLFCGSVYLASSVSSFQHAAACHDVLRPTTIAESRILFSERRYDESLLRIKYRA